jgi:hypothetical protein
MSDFGNELDAASDLVDNGPAAGQSHTIGNYGSSDNKRVAVPDKPKAVMSGVPPEQWAKSVKRH